MAEGGEEDRTIAIREIESRVKVLIPDTSNVPNTGPQNEELQTFVINCSQLFKELYDSLQKMFTDDDLKNFDRILCLQDTSTNRLLNDILVLSDNRRKLNDSLKSCASKLDNGNLIITIMRVLVSFLEVIHNFDSAFDKKFSKYLIKESYSYSYRLGLVSHIFFGLVSMSSYLSFLPECLDRLYSQWIFRGLMKASQQDMKALERVKRSLGEIEKMDEQVKELFLYGLDSSIVKVIDRIYSDCDQGTKIFATVFFSSLESNQAIINDVKFLGEMFLLSRMGVGKEWYNRALQENQSIDFLKKKFDCRKKLTRLVDSAPEIPIDLVKLFPDIELSTTNSDGSNDVEKKIVKLKLKPIPYLIFGAMNMFSIYSSCRILIDGEKHLYSDLLRYLSDKATDSLSHIDKFKNNISRARLSSLDRPA